MFANICLTFSHAKRPERTPLVQHDTQGGDVYATGHRKGRLASLDSRMTSLEARIGSGKSQNVNKAAATAAIAEDPGGWWCQR